MPPDDIEWPPSDLFGGEIEWIEVAPEMWVSSVRDFVDGGPPERHMWWVHNRPDGKHDGLARIAFGEGHHTLVAESPLHIEPSLLCFCGRHGFIRDGRWQEA